LVVARVHVCGAIGHAAGAPRLRATGPSILHGQQQAGAGAVPLRDHPHPPRAHRVAARMRQPYLRLRSFSLASSAGTSPQSPEACRSRSSDGLVPVSAIGASAPGVATTRPSGKRAALGPPPAHRREGFGERLGGDPLPTPPRQEREPRRPVAPQRGEAAPPPPPCEVGLVGAAVLLPAHLFNAEASTIAANSSRETSGSTPQSIASPSKSSQNWMPSPSNAPWASARFLRRERHLGTARASSSFWGTPTWDYFTRVPPRPVVEPLDVLEGRRPDRSSGGEAVAVDQFRFQRRDEALSSSSTAACPSGRGSRSSRPPASCTAKRRAGRPSPRRWTGGGSPDPVLPGEEGRRFSQDLPLLPEDAAPPPEPRQLLPFVGGEAAWELSGVGPGLLGPLPQRLGRHAELPGGPEVGLPDERTSRTASRRNSGGYGGLVFGTTSPLLGRSSPSHLPVHGGDAIPMGCTGWGSSVAAILSGGTLTKRAATSTCRKWSRT